MKQIKTPVNIDTMSLYQICRWSALEEAINIIGEKCDDRNVDFETVELKPLDILKYIDSATDRIYEKTLKITHDTKN